MAVLKVLELIGSSDKSWEDATEKAIAKASETVKNIKSAWVQDQKFRLKTVESQNIESFLKLHLKSNKSLKINYR